MKRKYTPEQQCDLDVKTSVNKIGEIVNLSQVLNSVYWDRIHHGATHDELHDLYCDVSTLDVMSNLEIDKAKKEFSVDNVVELNRLRDKYSEQLTTEDNKKILPAFLGWIAKQKGYYDAKHKAYLQHDTSMDYLQIIVRKFKTKNKIPKPESRLIDLFNTKSYREGWVNKKHVSHIMKYVSLYAMQVAKLFDHTVCAGEDCYASADKDVDKYASYCGLQSELIEHINNYRIGYSTMIFILKHFENKEYYKYRNILLPLFFTVCRQSFVEALIESREDIDVLVEGGNDITLFDFSYKIDKNSQYFA